MHPDRAISGFRRTICCTDACTLRTSRDMRPFVLARSCLLESLDALTVGRVSIHLISVVSVVDSRFGSISSCLHSIPLQRSLLFPCACSRQKSLAERDAEVSKLRSSITALEVELQRKTVDLGAVQRQVALGMLPVGKNKMKNRIAYRTNLKKV